MKSHITWLERPSMSGLSYQRDEDDWIKRAACASVGGDFWHPEKGGTTAPAKRICAGCPVRAECLAFGIDDRFGIYGGFSERERRKLAASGWKPGDPLPEINSRGGTTAQERRKMRKQAAA